MPELVVDASVAVKWFLPEPGEKEAALVLEACTPIAPDWILVEVAHALDKRRRRREIGLRDCHQATDLLRRLVRLHPASALVDSAQAIAGAGPLTVYDALYVALAVDRKTAVVTADEKLGTSKQAIMLADFPLRSDR